MMTTLPDGLAAVIEEDHSVLNDFMRAIPSRRSGSTRAETTRPWRTRRVRPARGWAAVSRRLSEASATLRDAMSLSFERVSAVVITDLAYTVEIEHYQGQQFAGSDERHDFDLRVRTIFRREPVGWRIGHRHADGITTTRPVESVLQR